MRNEVEYEQHQEDSNVSNWAVREVFEQWSDGPADADRQLYSNTDCGASISFRMKWLVEAPIPGDPSGMPSSTMVEEWWYGDDLKRFGTWKELDERGILVTGFLVSSIIEGFDDGVSANECIIFPEECTPEDVFAMYHNSVRAVEDMVDQVLYEDMKRVENEQDWLRNQADGAS